MGHTPESNHLAEGEVGVTGELIVSQARPNQPQHGSLSVSRTGKEGSGDSR